MKLYDYISIKPMGAVRQTKRDKWKKRDVVVRYHAFRDALNYNNLSLPEHYHLVFVFECPKSWTKKKKRNMIGKPHQQKPDKDNLEKAVLDAIMKEDSHIWDGRVTKLWGNRDCILVYEIEPPVFDCEKLESLLSIPEHCMNKI